MSQEVKQIRIQSRVDTKVNWSNENPILLDKEIGYERETGRYKIGDRIHKWNDLPYSPIDNQEVILEQLNNKVDKIEGKNLSTNDFTNEYKSTVDNIKNSINTAVAALVDSAPETLDTLNELAKALGNDPNFATTILNRLSQKADIEYVNNLFNSIINGEEVYY